MSELADVDGAPCFCGVCKHWAKDDVLLFTGTCERDGQTRAFVEFCDRAEHRYAHSKVPSESEVV